MEEKNETIQIGKEDLRWLLANTIREVCIQHEEYGCKPSQETADRILGLMGDLEIEVPPESDVSWLLDARKESYE
jgi:hypothetical protein